MSILKSKGLLLLILAFCTLSTAWNVSVPAYENLDEMEHTEVARHIAVTGKLPVHQTAEEAGFQVRQEASQPPLYHILGSVWMRLLRLPLAPPTAQLVPGTVVTCGDTETFYNKATWVRNPYQDGFPWQGHVRTVHALRLLSTLLQIATLAGTWTLARLIFPTGTIPLLSTAIVAFNPQFLLVAAGVNNDNLITPLAVWALVLLLTIWQQGPTPARLLGYGVLSGLAALSKLSGLGLLGLGGLVLFSRTLQEKESFWSLLHRSMLLILPALILLIPWLLHNWRHYGDPTALTPMLEKVGQRQTRAELWGTLRLMYLSYWGQLPCTFYPRAFYWPFALLTGGGVLGTVAGWKKISRSQKEQLLLLVSWFGIITGAWIRWNLITPATGGRLLFPAAPALAILIALGWQQLSRLLRMQTLLPRLWVALLPLLALLILRGGVIPLFAPPPLRAVESSVPHPGDYTFDRKIHLRGYRAELTNPTWRCHLAASSYCRPTLDVTLFWEIDEHLPQDWVLAIQLVSAAPGNDTLRLSYNHWPGHGNLPTSAWPVNQIIEDHYLLPLPATDFPTQGWDLQLAFFAPEGQARLPVWAGEEQVGDAARLTTMRVPGGAPTCPTPVALETPAHFGDAVALTHAESRSLNGDWQVALCWQSLTPLPDDYTVFVQMIAADGTLLGTGDGPPMQQAFPTHLWQPGDRIADLHPLQLTAEGEPSEIVVGLYHPESGARLPATVNGARLPNDAASIWSAQP
ncbi:MAG: glycosyltransferase family 39 protein [Chloroflexota bacterium]|nr:glycosyltransferase family 39 protein [Chloroflexota bacterium]